MHSESESEFHGLVGCQFTTFSKVFRHTRSVFELNSVETPVQDTRKLSKRVLTDKSSVFMPPF